MLLAIISAASLLLSYQPEASNEPSSPNRSVAGEASMHGFVPTTGGYEHSESGIRCPSASGSASLFKISGGVPQDGLAQNAVYCEYRAADKLIGYIVARKENPQTSVMLTDRFCHQAPDMFHLDNGFPLLGVRHYDPLAVEQGFIVKATEGAKAVKACGWTRAPFQPLGMVVVRIATVETNGWEIAAIYRPPTESMFHNSFGESHLATTEYLWPEITLLDAVHQ